MMKIKVDLSKLDTMYEVSALRCAAVAILSALPRDEAELAIEEWQAVTRVRDADEAEPPPRRRYMVPGVPMSYEETDVEIAVRQPDPEGDYDEISPDEKPSEAAASRPSGEISPAPEQQTAAPGEFEFAGRRFSTKKRGPRAALDHAVKIIQGCRSVAELDSHAGDFRTLGGIFFDLGRQELANLLDQAVNEASPALEAQDDPYGRAAQDAGEAASDSPAEALDVMASGLEAQSGDGEPTSDSADDGSDIPFEAGPAQPEQVEVQPDMDWLRDIPKELDVGTPVVIETDGRRGKIEGFMRGSDSSGFPYASIQLDDGTSDVVPVNDLSPVTQAMPGSRVGPPTPRGGNGAAQVGEPEPLRDLLRRAMDVLGRGRVADILEHHGATKVAELDEAGAAAVRAQVTAEMDASP